TRVSGARLTIDIYGAPADKKKIDIFTGPVKWGGLAGLVTVFDGTLPPGARKVVDKGSRGASVTVYRKITAPDGSVTTEVVSRDRYPAQGTIVAVGAARRAPDTTIIQPTAASQTAPKGAETRTD
ncbi:MAG: G5 domain-containing protein, partial [Armatimonadetes bacterium]|nr:G5 domain-containing protein [Armatimonadota bacterium]